MRVIWQTALLFVLDVHRISTYDIHAALASPKKDVCDEAMAPDLGWLQQYIEVGFFSDYKRQAWSFYIYNATSYSFLWLNSISYANLDFVREACPQAARLALLLRAEERLPMREAELPLLEYAHISSEARLNSQLSKFTDAGMELEWPLDIGAERLRRLTLKMSSLAEYTVDMVIPYCNEPLDMLLSRRTGYNDDWLLTRPPLGHVNLKLYRLECPLVVESSG